eukprot:TRINITY_DN1747_c0_g1_i2.p1 TRINITY_DN1747_c0_g1~~TRINITY_DN1747_c0_g1_i2.p1  ORF type:complete len:2138 (-),score=633.73 TRINITY_DN1747_c0_g1_i2:2166-7829(-)
MYKKFLYQSSLLYISPEQTGRTPFRQDYRSDYYSLGLIFYTLLSGKAPFNYSSMSDLFQCHLALKLPLLHVQNPTIPLCLSLVVDKLIQKSPSERYNSSRGLLADLKECKRIVDEMWIGKNPTEALYFVPGKFDVHELFTIPNRLYGIEKEISRAENLLMSITKISKSLDSKEKKNSNAVMILGGYSGSGKSSIIKEFRRKLSGTPVFFCSGKFDQYKLDRPYSAIVDSLDGLIDFVLMEDSPNTLQLVQNLENLLMDHSNLMVEIFPRLNLLLKRRKEDQITEYGPTEKKHIVETLFVSMFEQLAEHATEVRSNEFKMTGMNRDPEEKLPIVLILDDLQWCDSSSFRLIESLILQSESKLLFIGAHRTNETTENHPFTQFKRDMNSKEINILNIEVSSMSNEAVTQLVADTLSCSLMSASPLAQWVKEKGQGNPLFISRYLSDLYSNQFIHFDHQDGSWKWNMEDIRKKSTPPEDVVEFLLQKISQTPGRELLQVAACCGECFDAEAVAWLTNSSVLETEKVFWKAESEGYISKYKDGYRFLHDRLQQAAYLLNEEPLRQANHLKIGRYLSAYLSENDLPNGLFDVLHHLNKAHSLITEENERTKIASWNLEACKKSKSSLSYKIGLDFANYGLRFLPSNAWETQHDLAFELHLEKGEMEYHVTLKFDVADEEFSLCSSKSNNKEQRLRVENVRGSLYVLACDYVTMVSNVVGFLEGTPQRIPKNPSQEEIQMEYNLLEEATRGLSEFESLMDDIEKTRDPVELATLSLISKVVTSAFFTSPSLLQFIAARIINICMKIGFHPSATIALCYHAHNLSLRGDYTNSGKWNKLARRMINRYNFADKGQAIVILCFSSGLVLPLRESAAFTKQAFTMCTSIGDTAYAGYCIFQYLECLWFSGMPITEFQKESLFWLDWSEQNAALDLRCANSIFGTMTSDLITGSGTSLKPEYRDQFLKFLGPIHAAYYGYIGRVAYLMDRHEILEECAVKLFGEGLSYFLPGVKPLPDFYLYHSLSMSATFHSKDETTQKKFVAAIEKYCGELERLSSANSFNYSHMHFTVLAELEKITNRGREHNILKLYQLALDCANQSENWNHASIISELKSEYLRLVSDQSQRFSSNLSAKAGNVLRSEIKPLRKSSRDFHRNSISSTGSDPISSAALDLETVVKCSQQISSITNKKDLMKKLLENLISSSGATKGAILTYKGEDLVLSATGSIQKEIQVEECEDVDNFGLYLGGVKYSCRMDSLLTISQDQGAMVGKEQIFAAFMSDAYVKNNQVKSVVVLPFSSNGKKYGAIYLENNLYSGTFTRDRIRVIKVLVAQFVISLENAQLVKQLSNNSDELSKRNEELKAMDRMKDEFIAMTSHELRTPLSGILGMSSLISDTKLNAEQLDCISHIQNSAEILNELLNDIIEVTKLKARKIQLENKPVNIVDVIENSIGVVDFRALYKGLNIAYFVEEDAPTVILTDKNRLQQILVNLLNNAIKFSGSGDIIIRVSQALDSVEELDPMETESIFGGKKRSFDGHLVNPDSTVKHEISYLRIEVEDQGIGISEEDSMLLFKPFSQVESGNRRQAQGTGLGLHICRRICSLMKGKVWLKQSIPHKGSIFAFQVPATVIPSESPTLSNKPSATCFTEACKIGVLVSNELNRQIITKAVSKAGAQAINISSLKDISHLSIVVVDLKTAKEENSLNQFTGGIVLVGDALMVKEKMEFPNAIKVAFLRVPLKQSSLITTISSSLVREETRKTSEDNMEISAKHHDADAPKKKILIVEDNSLNRKMVCKMLEKYNYELECALNGKLAVEAVEKNHYDLILMDVQMPIMDGLQATELIRKRERTLKGRIPIIGLSASVSEHDQKVCIDVGMDEFIPKPIRREVLTSRLEHYLK